jgi:glycosyltransferase involved in cell wall biosynthesis
MMIGIVTQYGRNETTTAALRLADLALSLGLDVRLVATSLKESHIHPFWDHRVRSSRGDGIYRAIHGCTHVVHFEVDRVVMAQVNLVAEKAVQILVPRWHSLHHSDVALVKEFDYVVCPGKTCDQIIQRELFKNCDAPNLLWGKWDSGIVSVRREGTVQDAKIRVCFFCDASAIDFCATMLFHVINELLTTIPRLEITVLSTKTWPRRERREMRRSHARWGARLVWKPVGHLIEQAQEFHDHDWIVLPSIRADFGINVSRILACGAPVIAYNVEPFSELIAHKSNGLLIPCEIGTGALTAPYAIPCASAMLRTCQGAFSNNHALFSIQQKNWNLTEMHKAVTRLWANLWGLDLVS